MRPARSQVTVRQFLACAWGFAAIESTDGDVLTADLIAQLRERIFRASRPLEQLDPKVDAFVTSLETAGADAFNVRANTVAADLHVDAAHLSRLVRQHTGLGIVDWRYGVALRSAVRALADSNLSVQAIAYRSGFRSPSHFDHSFQKVFRLRPRDWRVLVRTGDLERR